jgi:hypothetical protein
VINAGVNLYYLQFLLKIINGFNNYTIDEVRISICPLIKKIGLKPTSEMFVISF